VLIDEKGIEYYGEIVESSNWVDLRTGGDVFTHGNAAGNDIRYRAGMSLVRDANGISFTGNSPWSSWVKFEFKKWVRGTDKSLLWIFTRPSSSMMIGIGSDATDESSSAQYSQGEVMAYFSSTTSMWGLYGNTGIVGNYGNQSHSVDITGGTGVYKIKFTHDGNAGTGVFTIYELPSANQNDWEDESNPLDSFTIGGSLNPDELNIMPFIIPRDGGSQRFIAFKIS